MKTITPDNCLLMHQVDMQLRSSSQQKSSAWVIVHEYCCQNGMEYKDGSKSGIEEVITFIDNLIKNDKRSIQTPNY